MPISKTTQTSFTAGELDPSLAARFDVTKYFAGAQELLNVLVRPQGGVRRRPGMRDLIGIDDGLDAVRLLPFAFNTEQTYCLLLTAGRFAVFLANGTYVANVGGAPWNAAQVRELTFAQSADTMLLFHRDMQPQRIRRGGSHASWTLDAVPLTNIPNHDFGAGAEPVISAGRGWPECGTFHDGRLWLAGLRSRPSTALASKVAQYFDFDAGTGLDDQALNVTIDSDQVNAIHQIRSGRALQMFTTGAEFAVTVDPPITPKNINLQEQTRRGIKRFTPTVEVDGAVLFIQRGGKALRQFLFEQVEQAYRSDLLSLLAPHLIRDPVDMAARKGSAQDDADHVLLVNPDGAMAVLTTLRAQEVTAFTRWETAGQIRAACALASGEVFFATVRNGQVRVEQWDEGRLLDNGTVATGSGITTVAGLAHLEGQAVRLLLDGADHGTAIVAGGQVALPRAADRAEVGLDVPLRVLPMFFEPRHPSGPLIGGKSRVVKATCRVRNTGLFAMRGTAVVLRIAGTDPAPALGTAPPIVTGDLTVRGMTGWRARHDLEIRQDVAAPFELLALSVELSF